MVASFTSYSCCSDIAEIKDRLNMEPIASGPVLIMNLVAAEVLLALY